MNGGTKAAITVAVLSHPLSVLFKDVELVSNVGVRATVCETWIYAGAYICALPFH